MDNAQMEGGSNRLPGWSVAPIFGPKKCHKVPMREGKFPFCSEITNFLTCV